MLVEQFATRREVRTAPDADGVALWLPPGEELLPDAIAEPIITELVEGAGPAADRLMEAFTILDAHHPHEPHWYLGFLGVQPALQGLGIGSALMQATLVGADAARRTGVPRGDQLREPAAVRAPRLRGRPRAAAARRALAVRHVAGAPDGRTIVIIQLSLVQLLVDERRQDLLASARAAEQIRSTRRAPRARRSLRGRRA